MSDFASWLDELNLGQYHDVLVQNDVDLETIRHLTDQDLTALGLSLGHRRKLMAAVSDPGFGDLGSSAATTSAERTSPASAERRQLTVMFCDLVGSTSLSSRLDPEDLRNLMQVYQDTVSAAIGDLGGFVAKFLGDGILAYFGFPKADENDPERAVRAALRITSAVEAIQPDADIGVERLQVRIGIATGLVVVGEMSSADTTEEHAIVGETPNLAARLQSVAEPGSVVIAPHTKDLVGAVFEYQDLGMQTLAGIESPVNVWRVLGEQRAQSRFDLTRGKNVTRLIAREEEVGTLRRRWEAATEGNGKVVLITGEAGIGKSRLVEFARREFADDAAVRLQFQCSQFHSDNAFYPVIGHLEHAAGFKSTDEPSEKLTKLGAILKGAPDDVKIFTALLRIPGQVQVSQIEPDPEQRKARILGALIYEIRMLAESRPVLCVFEDLHWADASTVDLVDRLVEAAEDLPILAVLTSRPDFRASWLGLSHVSLISLNRLDNRRTTELVAAAAGSRPLPDQIVEQITMRTDGVPLFVEELTRSVIDSGLLEVADDGYVLTGELRPQAIPATLQDSLTARLDRLSNTRETAQLGAAIGRRFDYTLISEVMTDGETVLQAALSELEEEGILTRRGAPPDASYQFRHALIQEAAYESLLKSTRVQVHERIARCLLRNFPDRADGEPAIVAHHFTAAGSLEEAIPLWIKAGERSVETAAFVEAISQFSRALELIRRLPGTNVNRSQEISALLSLGACQVQAIGPASDDVHATYSSALTLCEQHGTLEQRYKARWGLWFYRFMLGDVPRMRELADQLLPLADQLGDPSLMLEGYHCQWAGLTLLGDLETALNYTKKGICHYRAEEHHWLTFDYGGHDPGLCARNLNAVLLCLLGYPDQAKKGSDDAIARAIELDHSYTLLEGLFCGLVVSLLRGDHAVLREQADQLAGLAASGRLPMEAGSLATGFHGWADAENGRPGEGLEKMRASVADWQAFWGAWCFPLDAAYVAVLAAQGHAEEALEIIDAAVAAVGETGGHWWDAEFHRVRGNAILLQDPADLAAAQVCFTTAIETARSKNARFLELRAARDLSQLIQAQGDLQRASDVLKPVVEGFTEGFSTPDWQQARALLDRMDRSLALG